MWFWVKKIDVLPGRDFWRCGCFLGEFLVFFVVLLKKSTILSLFLGIVTSLYVSVAIFYFLLN